MNRTVNIISFDVPYPPNYGGVIDVFYKIKALHQLGLKIILHTFEYGREQNEVLNVYCKEVYYYKRSKNIKQLFSKLPFIINSRINKRLINNLQTNNYPILFEGLHTTHPLLINNFKHRKTLVRAHNVEHYYYLGLSNSEKSIVKKLYFQIEALKLIKYQSVLNKADYLISISKKEDIYFRKKINTTIKYISAFHQNNTFTNKIGNGNYALYHGDLSVSDNIKACKYLCDIFSETDYKLIIAGNTSNINLINKINTISNIEFFQKIENKKLEDLIRNAHINILPTFQNTGIKLKLINALFMGRHCLVNNAMIKNTGLEHLCEIANTKHEFLSKISILKNKEFTKQDILKREQSLTDFDNQKNAQKIIELLF